jgi:formyltetrahydrofolate deformylase
MEKKLETHILKLSCKDQIGIVAKISSILAESKCNIVESKQFTDQKNGNFFIRQSFLLLNDENLPDLKKKIRDVSKEIKCRFFLV